MRTDNAADIRLGAALENCIFYISPMYEFLHSLDPKLTSKLSQSVIAKFAGAMPDFTVGVMSDWSWTSI